MAYGLVRARGLEYGGREVESQTFDLKSETELCKGVLLRAKIIASNLVISDCASDPRFKPETTYTFKM